MELIGIIWLFIIITAIMALFVPFFVFRIRNEVIKLNKNMETLIRIMRDQSQDIIDSGPPINPNPTRYKICPKCGTKNRKEDYQCMQCGQGL